MKSRNVTVANKFGMVPVHQRNMFAVLEGMPVGTALSHAACIVDGLREMACEGVQTDGISASVAWLMEANLDTVFALLNSIEGGLPIEARTAADAENDGFVDIPVFRPAAVEATE